MNIHRLTLRLSHIENDESNNSSLLLVFVAAGTSVQSCCLATIEDTHTDRQTDVMEFEYAVEMESGFMLYIHRLVEAFNF
jgi:hypothetical protein